ncbi:MULTISPECIES: hypothetical protein [Rhizobium]|uniref:hypothetical protein n=1 Tax=Rhizobium TaxID=379 RepID=UPI001C83438F|nr:MULTISPECIES: hypothetical protein [Rhizobium]MBX4899661.1 hypothetical protein [Rhizobium bangladeshense]MBX5297601.1 hypothetical protein [Rhizobium sp. NLR15a]MBY3617857.1 hypothetical protein [Rhizobium bangladeshense]
MMELAAHMRHAGSFDDLVAVKLAIASIPIRMHYAAEVSEVTNANIAAITLGNAASASPVTPACSSSHFDGIARSSSWIGSEPPLLQLIGNFLVDLLV